MMIGATGEEPVFGHAVDDHEWLAAVRTSRSEPLRECVRSALKHYLKNLDGHEVNDLHEMVMGEVEHPLIETLLEHTRGNQTRAARLLGMSRSTLRKKIAQYEIVS